MAKTKSLTTQKPQISASRTKEGLTLKQEAFCQLYVNADRELFGNGTRCYMEVFNKDREKPLSYKSAAVLATKELKKVNVINRINGLLEQGGFNDENVDKQHLFLINQHADLKTKMMAIKEYNSLKKRIDSRLDGPQFNQFNFYNLAPDEIEREIITTLAEIKAVTKGQDLPESEG